MLNCIGAYLCIHISVHWRIQEQQHNMLTCNLTSLIATDSHSLASTSPHVPSLAQLLLANPSPIYNTMYSSRCQVITFTIMWAMSMSRPLSTGRRAHCHGSTPPCWNDSGNQLVQTLHATNTLLLLRLQYILLIIMTTVGGHILYLATVLYVEYSCLLYFLPCFFLLMPHPYTSCDLSLSVIHHIFIQ